VKRFFVGILFLAFLTFVLSYLLHKIWLVSWGEALVYIGVLVLVSAGILIVVAKIEANKKAVKNK